HQVFSFTTVDLLACIALGIAAGIISVLLQRGLRLTERGFAALALPVWGRAALGGLLVGVGGFFMPAILHDGYLAIQEFLSGYGTYTLLGALGFVAFKFLASCVTLGSGGSGGVFAPCLVVGSGLGYGFGQALRLLAGATAVATPSAYALVGMAGLVAGVMHAPLTGMFLVLEVTDGYELILPLMIVAVLAMLISYFFEEGSVYTRELIDRG
ncbi:MAG: chloride channel protein, partial [Gammaproteobacteria bacterium]|nr:chloride channel protein [Gammaproteobacteria bacterium]